MLSFTLDTNCIIAVEEQRPEAGAVLELVARQRAGSAVVRLVATTAAENQQDGSVLDNFSGFQQRLHRLGLGDLEILAPVAVCDLTYADWCVLAHDEADDEGRQLHSVLFPTAPFDYRDVVPDDLDEQARQQAERKWRNRQLDVLVLHTHIMARGDFRKAGKQERLRALGSGDILSPADAAGYGEEAPG
jgi:hypothetical protein